MNANEMIIIVATLLPKGRAFFPSTGKLWVLWGKGVDLTCTLCRAFLRNPVKYPDPDNFRPERWLEPSWPTYQEPLTVFPNVKGMSSFGWGQRACVGQTLTQDETVVACGGLVWGFNLKKKIDPTTGLEIDIDLTASNSLLIVKPDPFQMAFHPRSEARKAEMIQNWETSDAADKAQRESFLLPSKIY